MSTAAQVAKLIRIGVRYGIQRMAIATSDLKLLVDERDALRDEIASLRRRDGLVGMAEQGAEALEMLNTLCEQQPPALDPGLFTILRVIKGLLDARHDDIERLRARVKEMQERHDQEVADLAKRLKRSEQSRDDFRAFWITRALPIKVSHSLADLERAYHVYEMALDGKNPDGTPFARFAHEGGRESAETGLAEATEKLVAAYRATPEGEVA